MANLPSRQTGTKIRCYAPEKKRGPLIGGGRFDLGLLPLHQFDVQAERWQLADEHVERLGHAGVDSGLALNNGLVNFGAAVNVVGFRREQFLENVRGAIRFKRPHFHFSEPLAAELRLAAQRLLGDQRIGPDGSGVNLVVDQVREFEHVDIADGDLLHESIAGHAVVQRDLAGFRQLRRFEQVANVLLARAVEDRRRHGNAFLVVVPEGEDFLVVEVLDRLPYGSLAESILEPFANHFGARFLLEELRDLPAKFFGGHDARDDALVAVAAGHFVADGKLALHGDIGFHEFNYARRQLVAILELLLALLGDLAEDVDLARGHLLDLIDLLDEQRVLVRQAQALQIARGNFFENVTRQLRALGEQALIGALVMQVGDEGLAAEQGAQALQALVGENADFVGEVLFELEDLCGLDGLVALILFRALAAENLHVDDGAFDSRRAIERSVANVSGLFAEDRAQQLLFRRERGFALGRDFADQDVARLHRGADADHAAFVEVAEETLVD